MRQPSADYKGDHRLSSATTCPYLSPAIVSAVQMTPMATSHLMTQAILMAPLQKSWQIHHAYRENHWQQGQAQSHLQHKLSTWLISRSKRCQTPWGRHPHIGTTEFPWGIGLNKTILHCWQDHQILLPGPPGPQVELSLLQDNPVLPQTSANQQTGHPVPRTFAALTIVLCKTMSLAPVFLNLFRTIRSSNSAFLNIPRPPLIGFTIVLYYNTKRSIKCALFKHFKTIQSLNSWRNFPIHPPFSLKDILWWPTQQQLTLKGPNPYPSI